MWLRCECKSRVRRSLVTALAGLAALPGGCRPKAKGGASATASASAAASANATPPPWDAGKHAPATPEGMVWIPPGALVAGTPQTQLPRIAGGGMGGEQVVLDGVFF